MAYIHGSYGLYILPRYYRSLIGDDELTGVGHVPNT